MPAIKQIAYFLCACDVSASVRFLHKYGLLFKENKNLPARFMKHSQKAFEKSKTLSFGLSKGGFNNKDQSSPLNVQSSAHSYDAQPALHSHKDKSLFQSSAKDSYGLNNQSSQDSLFFWKSFCQKSSFEEVFPLILCGILGYRPEKASWLLKVAPETLSYRLKQGCLALNKELAGLNSADFKAGKLFKKASSSAHLQSPFGFKEAQESSFPQKRESRKCESNEDSQNPSGFKEEKALMYCKLLFHKALPAELEKAQPRKPKIKYGGLYTGLFLILLLILVFYRFLFSPSGKTILYSLTSG